MHMHKSPVFVFNINIRENIAKCSIVAHNVIIFKDITQCVELLNIYITLMQTEKWCNCVSVFYSLQHLLLTADRMSASLVLAKL